MAFTKINENDYANKGIRTKSNPLNMSVTDAQRAFDELPLDVIIPKVNALSEEIDEYAESTDIKIENLKTRATNSEEALESKVTKEEGKALSTNDYSNEEKQKVAEAYTDKHTHENKEVLDGVTAERVVEWDSKVDADYVNDVVNEKIAEVGAADMMQATYDPQGKQTDVFKYVDDAVGDIDAEDVGARPDTWMPTAEEVGASPSSHTHTAAEVGALPLSAGEDRALTGNLFIEKASPYLKFKNTSTGGETLMQDYSNELQITLKEDSNGQNKRLLVVRNVNSQTPAIENAFVLRGYVNGKYTNYSIYGSHNKPTGTYSGNGSSSRTISVGGTGVVCQISSSNGVLWVTPSGAFSKKTDSTTISGHAASGIKFVDGVITIGGSNSLWNGSSVTYTYQVL